MKALVAADYVPLDRIAVTDHPTPTPGPGQVLIKVEAAALNPLDLALITGAAKDLLPGRAPAGGRHGRGRHRGRGGGGRFRIRAG